MPTIEIKIEEDQRTFAARSVGPRLADNDFKTYYATIKRHSKPAQWSGYPKAVWWITSMSVASIAADLQAAGWTVALDDAARAACASGAAHAAQRNADLDADRKARQEAAEAAVERASAALARKGHNLFSFQREGILALAQIEPGRAMLLADEMGLGKTLQTVSAIGNRAVIVCPAVAKGVWAREIAAYRPDLKVTMISGRGNFRWPEVGEAIVINYDILPAAPKGKDRKGFDLLYSETSVGEAPEGCDLVADEAHNLKSNKAQRTLNFRCLRASVARSHGRTFLLTATPVLNRPPELWSLLTSGGLARAAFDSYDTFSRLFGARQTHWCIEWDGPSAEGSREIGQRLERVMLRRLRANVVDLPRKTYQTIPVTLSASCAKACDKFLASLTKAGKTIEDVLEGRIPASFETISTIRATLASAKMDALIEEIEAYEDAAEPVVVFSAHRAPIDVFAAREGWRVITGETSPEERTEIQDLFQAGSLRGVACTIKAGGVAITLTRANHAIFCDLEWTPALNAQAEDRVLRLGQSRPVAIKRLVAEHPLDERIAELLIEKQGLINASIEQTRGQIDAPLTSYVTIPLVNLDAAIDTLESEKIEREARDAEARETKTRKHNAKRSRYAGSEETSDPRPARTARETWAHYAILTIDSHCDGVREQDERGWSVSTRGAGHWLAVELDSTGGLLTDEGWRTAVVVASYHQAQVGRMPNE